MCLLLTLANQYTCDDQLLTAAVGQVDGLCVKEGDTNLLSHGALIQRVDRLHRRLVVT